MLTASHSHLKVPKIGTKQVFLAINPTPGGVTPYTTTPHNQQAKPKPPDKPSHSEQVSILVRPSGGGNAVLLNVPRNVALKVRHGDMVSRSLTLCSGQGRDHPLLLRQH